MKVLLLSLAIAFGAVANEFEVTRLKTQIIDLAESFKGQIDTDGSMQEELEILVDELLTYVPEMSNEEKSLRAIGAWNQIWGPYAFDGSDSVPPFQNVSEIYQVIAPEGFYYNFASYDVLGKTIRTFVRGNFEILDQGIGVEFTDSGVIRGSLDKQVYELIYGLEDKTVKTIRFPKFLPPTGITGKLLEVYADEDIRINYGTVGDDLSNPSIFIMQRVD